MKKVLAALAAVLILASCTFYEPEFRGGESFKVEQLEGKNLKMRVGAKVFNPNGFGIKIKPSTLDVFIDDQRMGEIHLDKKFKMKAKKETVIDAPITATLADGAMFRLMQMANQKGLTVQLKGKVKAGVWFVNKKIDVDETRTLDDFKMNLGL